METRRAGSMYRHICPVGSMFGIVRGWIPGIGLDATVHGTHTLRYFGIEVDNALEISGQTEVYRFDRFGRLAAHLIANQPTPDIDRHEPTVY
jgi:hypothetical protein